MNAIEEIKEALAALDADCCIDTDSRLVIERALIDASVEINAKALELHRAKRLLKGYAQSEPHV